ncbi:hypothetical protein SFR_6991 (plasmid) [Streptomyces sp. FR-008]|nr:hypothetical protein SFR_6991 [Streptomyces sp. FR-008]
MPGGCSAQYGANVPFAEMTAKGHPPASAGTAAR